MFEKIINWTAGSFFRTIGRLLVFVVLGFIIARVVDFGDIFNNFRITDLFFEKVNAMSLDGTIVKEVKVNQSTRTEGNLFSNDFTLLHYFNNSTIHSNDGDVAVFVIAGYTGYYKDYGPNGSNGYEGLEMNNILYSIKLINASGYTWTSCELQNNRIVCPMIKNNGSYSGLEFKFHSDGEDIYFTFQINQYAIIYQKDTTSTNNAINNNTNAINNQTQQQQQQHNELMDDNTTSTEEEASDFFSDFSVTDHGGLSSILTAPLTIFNSILNDSCVPASFEYRNETVTLPCGQVFWNQAPNVRDWLSTLESGIIAYAILIALFKLIQKIESPSNSEVEVESL